MTLILACITKNKNILSYSDQRTIDESGRILDEHKQKIFSFDSRCLIGFAGYEDISHDLLHYLASNVFAKHRIWYPEIAFEESIKYRQQHRSEHYMEYFIAGYNKENVPVLYYVVSGYLTFGADITKSGYILLGYHNAEFKYDPSLDDKELTDRMCDAIAKTAQITHEVNNCISRRCLFYKDIVLP